MAPAVGTVFALREGAPPLDAVAEGITSENTLASAVRLALALALWDEEFTAAGLFPGNIYLASEEAGSRLLEMCALTPAPTDRTALSVLLSRLFEAELIYRFPVALKFRGEFGPDRQFRLNCWGRSLAEYVRSHARLAEVADETRSKIRHHLHANGQAYRRHMEILSELRAHPPGAAWESALTLPIGVLF